MIRKNLGETSPTRGTAGGGPSSIDGGSPCPKPGPEPPTRAAAGPGGPGGPEGHPAPRLGAGNPGPCSPGCVDIRQNKPGNRGNPGATVHTGTAPPAAGYRPVRRVRKRRHRTYRYKPDIGDMTGKSDIGDITDLSDIPDIGYIPYIGYIPDIPDQSDMSDIPDTTDSTLNPQPHPHVSRKNGHKGRQRAKRYISGRDPRTAPG